MRPINALTREYCEALVVGRVRESLTLAGRAERARVFHAFVGAVLGLGHPCGRCVRPATSAIRENMRDARVPKSIKACASA